MFVTFCAHRFNDPVYMSILKRTLRRADDAGQQCLNQDALGDCESAFPNSESDVRDCKKEVQEALDAYPSHSRDEGFPWFQ
jgi:hypothetical protein